ncbi:MAG: hypothetical protein FWD57_08305 [Polyangiaceae bacterium]|nr:hypothetical protein [Polyangiaceae bacterium]
MRSIRTTAIILATLLTSVVPITTGCDESPSGVIQPEKLEVKIGKTASLEVFVRPKYDHLAREVWKVDPPSLGELYFDEASAMRRTATFRGKTAGTGKIFVTGFVGNPPPIKIAEIPVTVTE